MKHKILIADDSLTIQKVIKITLASEPFELFECTDAKDLESNLNENKPSIVLLDFNLSEDKTGYDLSRDIKKINPNAKILMLFGTFDTVDEGLLEESGVNHKIVKPFDGTKFINLCRVMADELDVEGAQSISETEADFNTDAFPEPIAESTEEVVEEPEVIDEVTEEPEVIEEDEWVVEGSQSFDEEEEEEVEETIEAKDENPLVENMKDWGMDVPGVIGGAGSNNEIPGVIGAMPEPIVEEKPEVIEASSEETVFPSGDDLAFPDEDDLAFPDEISAKSEDDSDEEKLPSNDDLEFPDMDSMASIEVEESPKKAVPQLRSIEVADDDEPVAEEAEVSNGGTDTDEALSALKAELEDELEDKIEAPEQELWGADVIVEDHSKADIKTATDDIEEVEEEFAKTESEDLPRVESHQLEKVVDNTEESQINPFDDDSFDDVHDMSGPEDFPSDVMDESPAKPAAAAAAFTAPVIQSDSELEARLREKLTPVVEDFVKEYCRESVEKIAWEIIPDLAENLIKKEIQKISESIINP